MKLHARAFTSTVARRAFVLFVTCALVPVSALAILSFQGVTAELQGQSERRLRQANKAVAMGLYRRLLTLEAVLRSPAGVSGVVAGSRAEHLGQHVEPELPRPFTALVLVTEGRRVPLFGRMDERPPLTAEERQDLAAGKTLLFIEHRATDTARLFLSRTLDPHHPDRGTLHAEINATYLWDFEDDLPPETHLMILDQAGKLLFSSVPAFTPPAQVARQARQGTSGHFEWNDGPAEYAASYWSLFLQSHFLIPGWTVILSQPTAEIFAPIADFKRTFLLVVLMSVWMVLLVSMRQIRKSLTPLERLQEGTRRIATGDFDSRVEVASRDEFEELAASFNRMAGQLGRQFNALAMRGEVSVALNRNRGLDETLQECAETLVPRLNLAVACVWTLGGDGTTLELRATAGEARRSDGAHGRIPLGQSEIGLIAQERRPHATNALLEDPRLGDREWAEREGLVAFVGHPLLVEDRLVGVAVAFARRPLDVMDLSSFASAAGEIAQSIERKRVEGALHGSQEQVRQLQKMEAVGRLAGGIAHDFNNLLTVISGHGQLLLRQLAPGDPLRGQIETIETTAERAALLTRQLLAFSRKQVLAPTMLDLNDVVSGMAQMLQRLIGESIDLVFSPGPHLGRVKVDPGQLEQVIVNLVVNARDAMPNGGRIIIETSNVELGGQPAGRHGGVSSGWHVMLAVRDTGTGMDAETQARIFEPFFTTKGPGKGTGLGLATVYGVVNQSGGSISVDSEPGAGTTFTIYFPRVDGIPEPVEKAAGLPPSRGSETILVVEDENEVRALVQRVLEDYGYGVLSAGRGAEALRIAEQRSGPIHLLLTDIVMPEVSGPALAERLVSLRPEMAVLYMSGYTDASIIGHGHLGQGIPFIQKPFTPEALARKIRAVLDSEVAGSAASPFIGDRGAARPDPRRARS
jgi:signal transduction histidine kinase/HAMP domain-containing protein